MVNPDERGDSGEVVTEVCIVGAGPAGITLARELGAHGVDVCLIEAGGNQIEPSVQRQSRGESNGYPLPLLDTSRVRAFGGSLRHPRIWDSGWAARRLDAIDFTARSHVPGSGWPFDSEHLRPYYERAERVCNLPPFSEARREWWSALSPEGKSLEDTEIELTNFQYPAAALHDAWDVLRCYRTVRVMLRTRVVETRLDPGRRRVERIVAVRDAREPVVIRPKAVVFAAGGIENARLLLLGDEGRGIGNQHDLVGRYFSERLSFHAGHVELRDPATLSRLSTFHRPDGASVGGALRVADRAQEEKGLLNTVFFLVPRPAAVTTQAVRSALTLKKAMRRRPLVTNVGAHVVNSVTGVMDIADLAAGMAVERPWVLTLRTQGEQAPNPGSRVTLGTRVDDLGQRVARVTWRIDPEDERSVRRSAEVVDSVLRARGLGSVRWTADLGRTTLVEGNHHHMGTTRMHEDDRWGVVNRNSRVHSVENLYVAGCSVFPTYGASNPTLTIIALAMRLADHLTERARWSRSHGRGRWVPQLKVTSR